MYTQAQGKALIELARHSIAAGFRRKIFVPSSAVAQVLSAHHGCYVNLFLGSTLRSSFGSPEPAMPLARAVTTAAHTAAFGLPTQQPITEAEFPQLAIQIVILSAPRQIHVRNPEDYLRTLRIGKDGILVRGVFESAYLLPHLAQQNRWDARTFLEQACLKAGMKQDSWTDFDLCRVYRFTVATIAEQTPGEDIVISA